MKPRFNDLTPSQQATYGNGCGLTARLLNVPDFIFTASCRHHDFNFERGSGTWWKAPYYYTRANWDFFTHMLGDANMWRGHVPRTTTWFHVLVSVVYFVGVMLFSWPWFTIGRWRTMEEILERDRRSKT